jgi:iron complex outermembrane receptor protein
LLSELNPIPDQIFPFPAFFFTPAPGGVRNTLLIDGGNPDLKPEKAKVWTAGADLKALDSSGFNAKLTYYHIVFADQISIPTTLLCICNAFNDAALLGPEIFNLNPQASVIKQLYAAPTLDNLFNIKPSDIGAIYDSRYRNLSTLKTSGLDFGAGYTGELRGFQLESGVDGTYVFDYDSQFENARPASLLNTAYNPINLRLRGRVLLARGPASGAVYVNFVNAYTDNNLTPSGHVSSWTTVDAVVNYEFRTATQPLQGASLSLSVVNLADRAPPYVANPSSYGITYDGVNANALGRYISLRLQKRW